VVTWTRLIVSFCAHCLFRNGLSTTTHVTKTKICVPLQTIVILKSWLQHVWWMLRRTCLCMCISTALMQVKYVAHSYATFSNCSKEFYTVCMVFALSCVLSSSKLFTGPWISSGPCMSCWFGSILHRCLWFSQMRTSIGSMSSVTEWKLGRPYLRAL
jgi:hypothetical protein